MLSLPGRGSAEEALQVDQLSADISRARAELSALQFEAQRVSQQQLRLFCLAQALPPLPPTRVPSRHCTLQPLRHPHLELMALFRQVLLPAVQLQAPAWPLAQVMQSPHQRLLLRLVGVAAAA